MRTHPILLLAVGLTLAACDGTGGPSTDGTLVVSTSTGGNDPDPDGFHLTVDGANSVALDPTGTAEVSVPPGRHTLSLLGVAAHCSVAPGAELEVDIPSGSTTPVAFEVTCNLTGVRITTTTTGLDLDVDGYRVEVDGADRALVPPESTVQIRLDPGDRTIALVGLRPNCTVQGSASQTVTIADAEVAPVLFAVACTATSGVIGVVVSASGTDVEGQYEARVDAASSIFVVPSIPAYLATVPAGEHAVSLVPPTNCSLESNPQSVTVTVGGLIRDTAEVAFSVTCVAILPGILRITAPTTGPIPAQSYSVWICKPRYDCIFYAVDWRLLGPLAPNDTLIRSVEPGRYQLQLRDVPARCRVRGGWATDLFTVTYDDRLDFKFKVVCSP